MSITREQAYQIAEDTCREYMLGLKVDRVLRWDESPEPCLYLARSVDRNALWIAYIQPFRAAGLVSSTVVAIDGMTGNVVYHGSAHDEG